MQSDFHLRSTLLEIGPEEKHHYTWFMIHTGGGDPDGKYKKTGSGSETIVISDPEELPTGTRASQSYAHIKLKLDPESGYTWIGGICQKARACVAWPFPVAEKIGEYAVKLEIAGSAYNIIP
ncbi:LOW QUALITY PROTEIN: hypothetical protein PHMEG_0001399 [Phytophthora megakarya]|uniref:Uncharacterized protein n=1 Tax=Phytophthora megakarya TaxID=4795 RepID=A0A225X388_9STRA|nr:LOW QUALITY PROTEIN: hypothetical protein PHMEG_0001399 [Phytophthora megakarya]